MRLKEMDNQPARKRIKPVEPPYAPDFGKPKPKGYSPPRGMDSNKWKTTREKGGYEVWDANGQPVSGTTWFTRVGAERERHKLNDGTLKIVSIHYVRDQEQF